MQITNASELQSRFRSGLQIVGEDSDGDLQWMGTQKEWTESEVEDLREEQIDNEIAEILETKHLNY